MNSKYIAPFFNSGWANRSRTSYHCPHCMVLASQHWSGVYRGDSSRLENFVSSVCSFCGDVALWHNESIIHPLTLIAPMANDDMPADCLDVYNEARSIASLSPKGAAALLRLCIQMLMPHLGQKGKNINEDIGALVKSGLPVQVQQALDVCRVIGNNAVHPGEIMFDEENQVVNTLFGLVNFIVENQITQPKQLAAMYESLPDGAKEGISKRDS
ncbi:DUF4145 domain-containing protein [Pantoea ananatis]|uniref:DUF4145 domain-containing protein n=1 Tax=Pantoea ananas TaxID=553 RepID=UPI000DA65B34|nr:DUF4145 domain-containing protein [Pantoea ananatis]PZD61158.1 hypothetical protein ARC272_17110 [Pantoea ananatis]